MSKYRVDTIINLSHILKQYELWNVYPLLLKKTALVIESSCYNNSVDQANEKVIPTFWEETRFVELYSNVIYLISINLDHKSSINQESPSPNNEDMVIHKALQSATMFLLDISNNSRKKIQSCILSLENIGYMPTHEFNPHINRGIFDEIEYRNSQKIEIKTTEMYLCNRCRNRKTRYWKVQTRSGDEGYTIFVECQVCYFQWKIY